MSIKDTWLVGTAESFITLEIKRRAGNSSPNPPFRIHRSHAAHHRAVKRVGTRILECRASTTVAYIHMGRRHLMHRLRDHKGSSAQSFLGRATGDPA